MTKRGLCTTLQESTTYKEEGMRLALGTTKFIGNSSAAVRLPPERTPQRRLIYP